jgi:hypothetical protein
LQVAYQSGAPLTDALIKEIPLSKIVDKAESIWTVKTLDFFSNA